MRKKIDAFKNLARFFKRSSDDERDLMEKLRDKYRLVVMNDETFEEVTSLKLTPLSVYVALSSLIVGTAILVTLLIIWTPLKRYIPGYGDFSRDSEISALTSKVANLEDEIQAHRKYNENFRKILTGDLEDITQDAVEKQQRGSVDSSDITAVNQEDIDRIPEDEQLRTAVARGTFTSDPQSNAARNNGTVFTTETPLEKISFIPPVTGDMTAPFDLKKSHFGVDIAAPKNTAIKTATNGVVISAGYTVETGYSIAIQHPHNVVTIYKHNSVLLKKEGETVKPGEAIAIIGNTGEATTGPHLHFEIWYKGRAINPADYINFK
ncbi:MAG: M23 family metallopeptidase [Saprospiraceae bacterium]|nr:M23 family metallopeptidase [Saprospiraceae bacterium]